MSIDFWKIAFFVLIVPIPAIGEGWTSVRSECPPTKTVTKARFDLTKPANPSAVLVLVPGVNGDGGRLLK